MRRERWSGERDEGKVRGKRWSGERDRGWRGQRMGERRKDGGNG